MPVDLRYFVEAAAASGGLREAGVVSRSDYVPRPDGKQALLNDAARNPVELFHLAS
jgi:hypothetical protein